MAAGVNAAIETWRDHDLSELVNGIKVIAFDLDNTLARSKKPMHADMASRFSALTRLIDVAVITGGRFELVESQVLDVLEPNACRSRIHVMPTSGTRYYRWNDGAWQCIYANELDMADRKRAIASIERHAREQGIWLEHTWGPRIEDRGSQITFSALGQEAPVDEKEHWDPCNAKKNRLAEAVAADLPNLVVRSGGSTSIDISARGVDKAYAVRKLCDILGCQVDQVVFIGDRMDPDGNDYPAAIIGTKPILVSGPLDTLQVCDRLIAALS
ncbi:HAD-IIB family hydrolase [Bifidobacterium sp. ESL0690]|uniref:HAD-IIB family hydrolase n=1 Tax=Bifidobacterium sp. ESL0690 TaxID=2983214 RepID=UPI0023F7D315|nr:HAD-IIB family hydrolase [Bifidobacterium sp. ESL0690]WEV47416.1 HAD-IIB family hydrolase [Bifidobacterium sp. ESL0690]